MIARKYLFALLIAGIAVGSTVVITAHAARQNPPDIRMSVEMVQLNVAVTDRRGKYITGLKPSDFYVAEDGIPQNMAMFAEGDNAPRRLSEVAAANDPKDPQPGAATASLPVAAPEASDPSDRNDESPLAGASVFVLFDTSNYMYHGFVYAQDAIADFVQSLQGPDRVALYSYSRDLFRASSLTPDRLKVLRSVRETVAGDNAALYDAILLTLRDAGTITGRRVIVVFSNGPDNASLAPPEDVEELAQSEGVAIYMISTHQAEQDPLSSKVFNRISASTGGEVYFAKNWTEEKKAFTAIRNDLSHLYTLYYYPQPNPNRGWRAITVKLKGPGVGKYRIRARSGYRPLPVHQAVGEDGATS
ncbi:MAG TPA: VWA domain-containing protein [Candidatus Acidoferrales bacterium]|nr:VWA domain-containing protein [Candidatus Acidoferrales bacterium]